MVGMMHFLPLDNHPLEEGRPFLVLRHGNDAADFLIQQVQCFEGQIYPDALDFVVDFSDRITDAVGWCEIVGVRAPETLDYSTKEDE